MTLSFEQFNKLATKEDHKELEAKVNKIDKKFDKMLNVLDDIAKNVKDIKTEQASNMGAHDRFETEITNIKKQIAVKTLNK